MSKLSSMFRRVLPFASILTAVLGLRLSAQAVRAAVPEHESVEPILAEETLPNGVGSWDLRLTIDYGQSGGRAVAAARGQLFFGIASRLGGEISLPLGYREAAAPSLAVGDVGLGLKVTAMQPSGGRPAVVLGLELAFPTGGAAGDVARGAYEIAPFVALLRDFGGWSLQGNIGWSVEAGPTAAATERGGFLNAALALPGGAAPFHWLVEVVDEMPLGETANVRVAPGVRCTVGNDLSIALAVPVGVTSSARPWGAVLQLQIGF